MNTAINANNGSTSQNKAAANRPSFSRTATRTGVLAGGARAFNGFFAFALTALAACALALFCLSGCGADAGGKAGSTASTEPSGAHAEKLSVVTSFYPMYDFAQKIAGDRAEVVNLVPAGTEPHDWEPSTADMQKLAQADVFVYNGAGMEGWVDDVLGSIGSDSLVSVEASQGAHLLAADDIDEDAHDEADDGHAHAHDAQHEDEADEEHAHGHHHHEHGAYDPHVWLAPENAKVEMANIRDALVEADPAGKAVYDANYEEQATRLDALDQDFSRRLAQVARHEIVVSHQAFGYLCDAYGLTQRAIEGLQADSEPDARAMAEICEFVKENDVKVIFSEELIDPRTAQAIADATGATCEQLNPLEGLTDTQLNAGEDYFSIMEDNLNKLVKALS